MCMLAKCRQPSSMAPAINCSLQDVDKQYLCPCCLNFGHRGTGLFVARVFSNAHEFVSLRVVSTLFSPVLHCAVFHFLFFRKLFMTLVHCGSLAPVHSNKLTRPSRDSASCSTSLHIFFFSDSSLQAASCERCCQHTLDCLCISGSDHAALDRSSWKLPRGSAGGIRSSARTRAFFSVPVVLVRESTPRPEPGVCGCGPCTCGELSASQNQWSEAVSEGAAFLVNLAVGFVGRV